VSIPEEEKRPIKKTEQQIYFELVIKLRVEKVSMVNKVNDRLSGEEDDAKYESKIKASSDL